MTKFTRRLQQIGNSLLVSLPKEWINSHNLKKGSQVDLETAGQNSLFVSVSGDEHRETSGLYDSDLVISYPLPAEENIVANTTGAYLLGYNVIRIESAGSGRIIPITDREEIRNSMRRLVGMEIIEEDASHIEIQFLLDAATLNPPKILKRMSSIAVGMCEDVTRGLISNDKSNLLTIQNRDIEVNRQYFLLVRLLRSTLTDRKLAGAFNLGSIDILDYRVAANLLENGGDFIVELAQQVMQSSLSVEHSNVIFEVMQDFERMASIAIDAFTKPDRLLAIESIAIHHKLQDKLASLRAMSSRQDRNDVVNHLKDHNNNNHNTDHTNDHDTDHNNNNNNNNSGQLAVDFIDIIHMYEKIARSWADVADLVKPIYNKM